MLNLALHHQSQRCSNARAVVRRLNTVAWGQNDSFQCGLAGEPVLITPTVVPGLSSPHPEQISAGRFHSAAVGPRGNVWTWGSGSAGKLGQPNSRSVDSPQALNDPQGLSKLPAIRQLACGHQHTLLLDTQGCVWSCGENKEGQCGIGTSFEDIARQRRQEWNQGIVLQQDRRGTGQQASHSGSSSGPNKGSQAGLDQQAGMRGGRQPADLPQHAERQQELKDLQRLMQERERGQAAAAEEAAPEDAFALKPGQIGRPMRLSCTGPRRGKGDVGPVVQIAASRFFSVLLGKDGNVWSFGGGYNGELGPEHAWATRPQPIGPLQEVLDKEGGVRQVSAGSTFTLCLAHQGQLGVLGRVPGEPALGLQTLSAPSRAPFTAVAAGHRHAVMTDGQRVWTAGRFLSADGRQHLGAPWGEGLQQHLDLGSQRVAAVAAGAHCCAALSESGQLFLWGHLISPDMVKQMRQDQDLPQGSELWPGLLGSDTPVRLGLSNVAAVSIGATHALALVS